MCFLSPVWRSFSDLPLNSEASRVSASFSLSLATLEVACNPGIPLFALVERKEPDLWRWAIAGAGEPLMEEGCEPTQEDAKKTAVAALERTVGSLKPECSEAGSAASPGQNVI
ncbi:MAG TPA: hypothetical protein VN829_11945 [Dongiaceae bacterium]|nr:hypothetical protein [Dongiaceae bacterium]